jgi:hypothetical protein
MESSCVVTGLRIRASVPISNYDKKLSIIE